MTSRRDGTGRGDGLRYSRVRFTGTYARLTGDVSPHWTGVDYDALHPIDPDTPTGENVARAKRTARAEARRRYRAATEPDLPETEEALEHESAPRRSAAAARSTPDTARPGIMGALRSAYHRPDIRSDVAWLPNMPRSKAFWLPLAAAAVAAVAYVAAPSAITYTLMQYLVWAPPIGLLFIAGFLAPRASWLFGVVLGLVSSAMFAVMLYSGAWNVSAAAIGAPTIAADSYAAFVAQWIFLSLLAGPFFASAAAWYRRFLQLSNPNRGRRPQQPQKRVGDGRTRGTASPQKASVRR